MNALSRHDPRRKAAKLAEHLPDLLVAAERIASTVAPGVHGRRRVGSGETFWQFRRYLPGDSINRIDWRQSAKSDRTYIRETEWEAAQSVWLWRDPSASMDWCSRRNLPEKRYRAEVLLLALAMLLQRGGERVALLGSQQRPASSPSVIDHLALELNHNGKGPWQTSSPITGDATTLPPIQTLPRHGRIVLLGDFLDAPEAICQRFSTLQQYGVRGHVLQILDPAECGLPYRGRIRFAGLEAGETDEILPRVDAVRTAYLNRLAAQQAALQNCCARLGWTFAIHHTSQSPQPALLALFHVLAEMPA